MAPVSSDTRLSRCPGCCGDRKMKYKAWTPGSCRAFKFIQMAGFLHRLTGPSASPGHARSLHVGVNPAGFWASAHADPFLAGPLTPFSEEV